VFAGRLDPVKRPLLVVDIAFELVKLRGGRNFSFLIAGNGPDRERIVDRVRRAGLDSVFGLLGRVDDMPKVLVEADVLVVPSQAECIPLIVLEALATAKPVVLPEVGAVDEVLDPCSGILIKPGQDLATRFAAALRACPMTQDYATPWAGPAGEKWKLSTASGNRGRHTAMCFVS
jgi:glycosyltransferase involved in cell wall biosynthesis